MVRTGELKVWTIVLIAVSVAMVTAATASVLRAKPAHAGFSGTPNAIAFTTNRDGHLEVYRMGSDAFGPTRFADQLQGNSNLHAFSPDGSKVAFTNDTSCFDDADSCSILNTSVYVSKSDNSNFSATTFSITENDTSSGETEAAWYPSGRRIAFTSNSTGGGDVYYEVLGEDGFPTPDQPVRLTTSRAFDGEASVSPNGKKIAFVSERDKDGDREIYVMNANSLEGATNKPLKLINNTVPDEMPDWSPDGKLLVFERGASNREIFKMNADGTKQVNLTRNPAADLDPCFSPDGKKIAFDSNRDGDREIWRMKADGSRPVNLTNNSVTDANPSWRPIP